MSLQIAHPRRERTFGLRFTHRHKLHPRRHQHIFQCVVVVGFVTDDLALLKQVNVEVVKSFDIAGTAWRQEKLNRFRVWCDQQIHFQSIEVAFVAG